MKRRRLAGLIGGLALATSVPVLAVVVIPGKAVIVMNRSGKNLACRLRIDSQPWGPAFALPAGEEHRLDPDKGTKVRLFCGPPAERKIYRLRVEDRFVFLQFPGEPVRLRHVEVE